MIIFGPPSASPLYANYGIISPLFTNKKITLLNLSSLVECGDNNLYHILPKQLTNHLYSDEGNICTDRYFIDYIRTNNLAFMDIMKIILPIYEDPSSLVYILIEEDDYRDFITELVCKYIQVRYSISGAIISSIEDILYLTEDPPITIDGILNIDYDKERLSMITQIDPKLLEGDL